MTSHGGTEEDDDGPRHCEVCGREREDGMDCYHPRCVSDRFSAKDEEIARLRAEVEESKRLYYVAHDEERPARKEARLAEARCEQLEAAMRKSIHLCGHDQLNPAPPVCAPCQTLERALEAK